MNLTIIFYLYTSLNLSRKRTLKQSRNFDVIFLITRSRFCQNHWTHIYYITDKYRVALANHDIGFFLASGIL